MKLNEVIVNLTKDLNDAYQEKIEDLREYLKLDFNSQLLSDDFHQTLYKIIFSSDAEKYSPLKSFWLKSVEDFFFILELHYDQEDGGLSEEEEQFSEEERLEELEEAWLKTPFANAFSEMLSEEFSAADASMALISLMESQLLSFFYIHFPSDQLECETAFLYNANPEFGDYENRIYLTDKCNVVEFEQSFELFPSIPIAEIDHSGKVLGIDENAETSYLSIDKNKWSFNLPSGKTVSVLLASEDQSELMDAFVSSLEQAFNSNKTLSLIAETIISVIIPTAHEHYTAEGLFDRIYINPLLKGSELDAALLTAASDLLALAIDEAYQITTEDDDSANFTCPWRKEKLPYLPIALETISRTISGRINSKELSSAKELFDSAKKDQLISDKACAIIDSLLD